MHVFVFIISILTKGIENGLPFHLTLSEFLGQDPDQPVIQACLEQCKQPNFWNPSC